MNERQGRRERERWIGRMRVQDGGGVFVLASRAGMDGWCFEKQKGKGGNFREIWCVAYLVLGTLYLLPHA
jgi:hypothetical protein